MKVAEVRRPVRNEEQRRTVRPMRILLVVDGYYPSTGGAEMQARLVSRALAAAGHRVEVVAPWLDRKLPRTETLDGVPLTRLAYPRVRLLGALWLCAYFGWWLWHRRRDYDAIHVHMAKNLASVAGLLRPLLRATLTVKISGAWEFNGGILDPRLRHKPLYRVFNWCIRRADSLQCVSDYTRRMLQEAGYPPARLRMIPNAVDISRFSPPATRERTAGAAPHVVFVGRIQPVKGLPVLVEAWSRLARATPARLTIAGDGAQREALMQTAREKGVADSIEFPGEIRNVPQLLQGADIYVQPSFQEGLPNSVLEAMAMGLPIVATRVSGNEDVVTHEDNGLLVSAGDDEGLAAALRHLIEDPQLAARMGARSRALIEQRFSLPAVIGALERAYRGEGRA
jgi:glycosyltransferase involved in cell wall biosynthesis